MFVILYISIAYISNAISYITSTCLSPIPLNSIKFLLPILACLPSNTSRKKTGQEREYKDNRNTHTGKIRQEDNRRQKAKAKKAKTKKESQARQQRDDKTKKRKESQAKQSQFTIHNHKTLTLSFLVGSFYGFFSNEPYGRVSQSLSISLRLFFLVWFFGLIKIG